MSKPYFLLTLILLLSHLVLVVGADESSGTPKYKTPVISRKVKGIGKKSFPSVGAVDVDSDGNYFVACTSHRLIVMMDNFHSYVGNFDGGSAGGLGSCVDICVMDGILYVLDNVALKVIKYDYALGEVVGTIDIREAFRESGLPGQDSPNSIVVDTKGRIFLSHRDSIICYSSDGVYSFMIGGVKGSGKGQLNFVTRLNVDFLTDAARSRIYATEFHNYRVQIFEDDGTQLAEGSDQAVMFGRRGNGKGKFMQPTGIAVDKTGRMYVTDRKLSFVQVFSPKGKYLYKFGETDGATDVVITADDKLYLALSTKKEIWIYSL